MGLFSFLKKKKPEGKIPTPPSPPGKQPKPIAPLKSGEGEPPSAVPSPKPSGETKEDIPAPRPPSKAPTGEEAPRFPSMPRSEEEKPPEPSEIKAPRQVDDFGMPSKEEFELPDIEQPKFKFPSAEEKAEVEGAIGGKEEATKEKKEAVPAKPKPESKKKPEKVAPHEVPLKESKKEPKKKAEEEVPEELPEIGEETPKFEFPEGVEEPQMKELPKTEGPVYIKGDNFMAVKKGLNSLKDNLKKMDTVFADVNEIKNKQEADIDVWHSAVEEIQRKLVYIDRTIFEQ